MSRPADIEGTVIRLPMVYGASDYQHRMFSYLKRVDDGRGTILLGELQSAWQAPRLAENIGEAIALCALHPRQLIGSIMWVIGNICRKPNGCERSGLRQAGKARFALFLPSSFPNICRPL